MEKGLNSHIKNYFHLQGADIRTYSPLALAYIGDGVFDLIIRSIMLGNGNAPVNKLHTRTSRIVKAGAQAKMMEALLPSLTEGEKSVYRRGRNANPKTTAKNAAMSDYRKATGFEALLGYLYLEDQWERMFFLVKEGLKECAGDVPAAVFKEAGEE